MTLRGRRWLLVGLLLVFGGLIAALVVGPRLLDQERYRSILTSRAGRLLNRTVTTSSLRAHLLPSPGVTIRDLSIADRATQSEPFLRAERLDLTLKLLPLLKGDIQIGTIRLDRPRIRLVKGPDGWNVDDLIWPTARETAAEPRRTEGPKTTKEQPAFPALAAEGLTIRHGTLILETPLHPSGPANLQFDEVDLDISDSLSPAPIRIHASGVLPDTLSGSFDLSASVQRAEGDRVPIDTELQIQGIDAAQLVSALGFSHAPTGLFSGTLDLTGKAAGVWPTLELQVEADLRHVGVAGTSTQDTGKVPGDQSRLRAKGRWEGDTLNLSDMNLLWKGQTITGRLRARHSSGVDGLQIEGHLRSDTLRWDKLLLTNAEGDLRYCCGLLSIRQLHGGFYGGTLSGDVAFAFSKPAPRVTVTTHLEGIQIEPFLKAIQDPQWTMRGVMTMDSKMELPGSFGTGALAKLLGQTDMAVTNGRVIGYAPLERLSKTVDPILKEIGIPPLTLNEFDRLSAHWTIDGGVLRTRDLTLLRNGTTFYAVGSADLLNQTLDFDVTAKLGRTTLEARVHGPSSDPAVTPQMGRIEGRIKTDVGKLLGKDRKKEIGKMLQQLFSR